MKRIVGLNWLLLYLAIIMVCLGLLFTALTILNTGSRGTGVFISGLSSYAIEKKLTTRGYPFDFYSQETDIVSLKRCSLAYPYDVIGDECSILVQDYDYHFKFVRFLKSWGVMSLLTGGIIVVGLNFWQRLRKFSILIIMPIIAFLLLFLAGIIKL
ncbi:hypothetical protein KC878_03385 [Candidatus Saccharibacteria bacterium]|nr:hypothetical protein [Candidatus Saccharibacteria bacterium]MCB9820983.1 hypothetical protein [Candidatus Nomurabacteria bacterium]